MNHGWLAFMLPILLLFAVAAHAQNPVQLAPNANIQYLDPSGTPLAGGKIFTYAAGTNTPQAAYSESTGTTVLPNPIILNAAGYVVNTSGGMTGMWLTGSCYKIVLENSSNVTLWTMDNVCGNLFPSGDNMFTGDNTFSGHTTFSGPISTVLGGALGGSFSGNPNFTGNPNFSGTPVFSGSTLTLSSLTSIATSADAGFIRMGHLDAVNWRNHTNTDNFGIAPDGLDNITFSAPIRSTITSGTAPIILASSTNVPMLNASSIHSTTDATAVLDNLVVNQSVLQGVGFKHQRFGATCTTGASIGNVCSTTFTWTNPFNDASYTPICTPVTQTAYGLFTLAGWDQNGVTVEISALTNAAASYDGVNCIATHD